MVILITTVVTALVVGGGVYFWQRWAVKEEIKPETSKLELVTLTPAPTFVATPTPDKYKGWLTYTNEVYSYEFRYPKEAAIEEAKEEDFGLSPEEYEAGMTFADKYKKYTSKICVYLTYKFGYINISAPPNKGHAHAICGRTGRAYEGPEKSEDLTIDGEKYTAEGFEEKGPGETLSFHNETLWVLLDDETTIEYGALPDETKTFADYLAMREEILKIVESYRKI